MSFAIGEKQIAIIDTEENRSMVKMNITNAYEEKFLTKHDDVNKVMKSILEHELANKNLYTLLLIDVEDADLLVWDTIFHFLKGYVNEKVYGAEEFFSVGRDAMLSEDKWYDEYQGLFKRNYINGGGIITDDTYEFCREYLDENEWAKKIEETCDYVRKCVPTKCKWVAFSNDGAYVDNSRKTFADKKECYDDMRNAVLRKMTWNTEFYVDFNDADDAVEYKVRFKQDMIIHESYSGIYVYKIVGEDETFNSEKDIFTEEFDNYLRKIGFHCIVG